ncbi:MAG: hypothetical protein UR85_C0001G0015 [Candidatus Nomurabacteria bacterium GW2011_GWF2_35_66]|uniref:DoxX family protein n=1 Tax=Candidatus Nomurabacteria bacterium GW2011_GWE1_35_16 TaxID=1618761 RepID=A0A0G0DUM3_9BACT|nr:MAG: hypothetical protein UR55_C0003G0020 [Candidatus Nomurabacteria bacterium GW2011_GWF1_34_20]KKP63528.1 MAG: hypothetical protein UR57_C0003G0015 [Candidatus Nomurabacteria bacterium GW2011_GWE2_34_25]KKP66720.1 MAG: hypothetical protein UR64_C0003G0013 [Candidatus Nomurabacteria bacterium GW2011_GWE1_35_16]KKP83820.1 MAG: hypothetical protein UR85_C0001G0015 [Candidatus Nomurabacteria bacterium GW2011_GWF2_35_66]HAE36390.1 DoxX family protein [Candidatus Nomurabacteria bacterium]
MKTTKIIFWISTAIIFLAEGVVPALTSQSEMSIQGITSLGYPVYFVTLLTVFKVLGAIVLIVPQIPNRVKEWAYAGFMIDFISAFVSIWVVAGFNAGLALPLIAMVILIMSYVSYSKIQTSK